MSYVPFSPVSVENGAYPVVRANGGSRLAIGIPRAIRRPLPHIIMPGRPLGLPSGPHSVSVRIAWLGYVQFGTILGDDKCIHGNFLRCPVHL